MYLRINMLVPLPVRSGSLGQAFFYSKMSKIPFNKPPLSYSQQIQLLIDRGLIIERMKQKLFISYDSCRVEKFFDPATISIINPLNYHIHNPTRHNNHLLWCFTFQLFLGLLQS